MADDAEKLERVADLLSRMTVREQAQLVIGVVADMIQEGGSEQETWQAVVRVCRRVGVDAQRIPSQLN